MLKTQTLEFDRMINAWHRSNETPLACRRGGASTNRKYKN